MDLRRQIEASRAAVQGKIDSLLSRQKELDERHRKQRKKAARVTHGRSVVEWSYGLGGPQDGLLPVARYGASL